MKYVIITSFLFAGAQQSWKKLLICMYELQMLLRWLRNGRVSPLSAVPREKIKGCSIEICCISLKIKGRTVFH